jgi:hypothetical protein
MLMLDGDNRTMKIGVLGGLIVVALLVIGYFAWGELNRNNKGRVADVPTKPNMYNFEEEARKGNLGKRAEGAPELH